MINLLNHDEYFTQFCIQKYSILSISQNKIAVNLRLSTNEKVKVPQFDLPPDILKFLAENNAGKSYPENFCIKYEHRCI